MKAFRTAVPVAMLILLLAWGCAAPAGPDEAASRRAAAPGRTMVIGFTASQTGSLNVEGTRQLDGLNLWIEQVNASGGIRLGDGSAVTVQARYYDDESNKSRVQELYTRLINEDQADFLISPYSSGLAEAAAVIAEQHGRIMITAGAASDSTHRKGYSLVYQSYTPASRYLTGACDLLASLDPAAKTVAIIHENDQFSTDVSRAARAYAEGQGFRVVSYEGYDSGATDFGPFINKLPRDVDAVMGGGHFADGATLAKQLYEKGLDAKFVALLVSPLEPSFPEIGAGAEGVIGPSQWEPQATYSPGTASAAGLPWYGPSVADFLAAYRTRYGEEPSYHSAGGYAAGLILQQAVEKAGSLETSAVKAALDGTAVMTFFGTIQFDTGAAHGLQTGHQMVYVQWQRTPAGQLAKQMVWPASSLSTPAQYPARAAGGTLQSRWVAALADGLSLGSLYAVVALGMTLIWGVMNVLNLSHGATIALGMFGTYLLFSNLGLNPYLAIVVVAAGGLVLGVLIYETVIRRVISAPHLSSMLATFSINMVIIGLGTALFTTSPRTVAFAIGTIRLGPLTVQGTRLAAVAAAVLLGGGLQLFLYRTLPGKAIRAVAGHRSSAELMGIPTTRVLALAFGLGTLLAAAAGGLIATFFPFTILSGSAYESKSFVICVLGGLGSPAGALLGGIVLGLLEGVIPAFVPVSWVPVLEFGLFVLILLLRPRGLLGAAK